MKDLLILTVSCITLALCHGVCMHRKPELVVKDGEFVAPDGCFDPQDNSKHDIGSQWNTTECMSCSCDSKGETHCCTRYGGIKVVEGCKTFEDPETCTYKHYKIDDPSTPCAGV